MTKRYLRATKPEEKEERKLHLLDVARSLIEAESDLNLLSLNEIARSAKMAKANIYRYFETREALLLDLLWDEWQIWFSEFQKDWSKTVKNKNKFENLIKALALSLSRRELLCNLTTALPSVVEKNLSEETIREFKYRSIVFFGNVSGYLETSCNHMSSKEYAVFLQDSVSLIAGIYPFAHPNHIVEKVLSDPQLRFFKRDFASELERYMLALANDLKQQSTKKKRS